MANPKKKIPKSDPAKWVRSSTIIGSPDMDAIEQFALDGAGVDETDEVVGAMPNDKFLKGPTREIV